MTIEYIRYRIDESRADEFVASYREAAASLDASEYCRGYEMTRCEEEPERFILRIEWTSTADHLGKFRSSAPFRTFFACIRPYVNDIEEMQHYQPVAGLSSPSAASSRET